MTSAAVKPASTSASFGCRRVQDLNMSRQALTRTTSDSILFCPTDELDSPRSLCKTPDVVRKISEKRNTESKFTHPHKIQLAVIVSGQKWSPKSKDLKSSENVNSLNLGDANQPETEVP
jgi:hypothetical protein